MGRVILIFLDLTKEFVKNLWNEDDKICPILKKEYAFGKKNRNLNPSLDRIDNNLCHSNENTVIACLKCNLQRRCQDAKKFTFTN